MNIEQLLALMQMASTNGGGGGDAGFGGGDVSPGGLYGGQGYSTQPYQWQPPMIPGRGSERVEFDPYTGTYSDVYSDYNQEAQMAGSGLPYGVPGRDDRPPGRLGTGNVRTNMTDPLLMRSAQAGEVADYLRRMGLMR